MSDFDVIVVGTRCAGASLAMLLAREGYRVLNIDRAHFPSVSILGHPVAASRSSKLHASRKCVVPGQRKCVESVHRHPARG